MSLACAVAQIDAMIATGATPKRNHLEIVCMRSSPLPTNWIKAVHGSVAASESIWGGEGRAS
jgi:hypothetical protein